VPLISHHHQALSAGNHHHKVHKVNLTLPLQISDWPGLGDVWDDMKEGADNLTAAVGDMMDDPVRQVPTEHQEFNDEVTMVAEAIRGALHTVITELDTLVNETTKDKHKMMRQMGWLHHPGLEELMPRFENSMREFLGTAHGRWTIVQDSFERAMLSLVSGLEAGHQDALSRNLRLNIQIAQTKADKFLRAVSDARAQVEGMGMMPLGTVCDGLQLMNTKLSEAIRHLSQFVALFQQAFMDLVDTISNTVTWSQSGVDKIFGTVEQDVTSVIWRVRAASRELVLGARSVLVAVAQQVGVELPPWNPVYLPLLHSGAGPRGGPLLIVALLGIAGLVA